MRPATACSASQVLARTCALMLMWITPAIPCGGSDPAPAAAVYGGAGGAAGASGQSHADHDRRPIRRPPDWEHSYWGSRARQGFVEPLGHLFDVPDKLLWVVRGFGVSTRREAVDVDAFDEIENSTWFTNRNHVRAVPVSELRQGPDSVFLPAKPWTIKSTKKGGWSPGFQIKDADGKKWLVKLDPRGSPQLSSGADMVARTLLHAAGYNVPHNEPVRFQRGDVRIDPELLKGSNGKGFTEADLDTIFAHAARFSDSSYSACASLFLTDHVLGSPSMNRSRPGDSNDWYQPVNRRELRGLFPLCAWLNDWDTEDHQFLDTFVEARDSLGYVEHYVLDLGSSFGASAIGPKQPWEGFENALDLAWIGRRIVTLGFAEEPWRRARQETGIPSVGIFESEVFDPGDFRTLVPQPAFRARTDRDSYWGAKIVASFSDAQIAAAVEAAHFEDPRAVDYLTRSLIVRRDKTARYWFARVAPLDFFVVEGAALRFHDLAADIGLVGRRAYDLEVEGRPREAKRVHLDSPEVLLDGFEVRSGRLSLVLAVAGSRARPTRVDLRREGTAWRIVRVRHG
jgi:hypothetical protein